MERFDFAEALLSTLPNARHIQHRGRVFAGAARKSLARVAQHHAVGHAQKVHQFARKPLMRAYEERLAGEHSTTTIHGNYAATCPTVSFHANLSLSLADRNSQLS